MQASRYSILTLVEFYLPGYKAGGAIRTLANMVEQLGDELEFSIIAKDRDSNDPHPYAQVRIDEWNRVGKARVFYASPRNLSLGNLTRIIRSTSHDVLYLNSFFDPVFTLQPLLARRLGLVPPRPALLAPRGEFSEGALALKAWKKRSYQLVAKAAGLYRHLVWQASSAYEARDIRAAMGAIAQRVEVAPDLSPLVVENDHAPPRSKGPLRVLFLARMMPNKNVDYTLRALAHVRSPVDFSIYGPIEDPKYWASCEALMRKLPAHVSARYGGSVEHAQVDQLMRGHDLLFLPSQGENFGHVILEALLAGCPVLISDRTPWRDLERQGVGWDLPLEAEGRFVEAIEQCAGLNADEHASLRRRVVAYARQHVTDPSVVDANRRLFRALASRSE